VASFFKRASRLRARTRDASLPRLVRATQRSSLCLSLSLSLLSVLSFSTPSVTRYNTERRVPDVGARSRLVHHPFVSRCSLSLSRTLLPPRILRFSRFLLVVRRSAVTLSLAPLGRQVAAISAETTKWFRALSFLLRNRSEKSAFKVITRCSRVINFRPALAFFLHARRARR